MDNNNNAIRLKLEEELKKLTQSKINVSSDDYNYIITLKDKKIKVPKIINNIISSNKKNNK